MNITNLFWNGTKEVCNQVPTNITLLSKIIVGGIILVSFFIVLYYLPYRWRGGP